MDGVAGSTAPPGPGCDPDAAPYQEPKGDSGTALSQLRIQLYRDLSRGAAGRYLAPDGLRPLPEHALVVGPGLAGLTKI
jgi:hypothetical protein